jgi:hypothetical protein
MAASGKNRRGARGHLLDVSAAVSEREGHDAWLAQSSATLTQRRPLETSGQVGVVIDSEEYEEYSRLKSGAPRNRPESTNDPSESPPSVRRAGNNDGDGAVQDVASFLAQLATPSSGEVGRGDEAESEDEFLAQLLRAPAQPGAAPSQQSGSAALEGVTTIRRSERRPPSSRLRVRFPRRWRWVSLAAALLAVAGVGALLLHAPTQTASPGSPSATSHATTDTFAGLRGTLEAIDSQVGRATRGVVSRERAEIAAERTRAARHDSAAHSRVRRRHRAHPVGTRSHPVSPAGTVTQSAPTSTSSTPAPTQTVTAPVTGDTSSTPQPTSTTRSAPAKTATHPYGEGGVLGAGHVSGGS